jgi:hypothetical protein
MKLRVVVLCVCVLAVGLSSRTAHADLNKVRFERIAVLNVVGACAIQVMIQNIVNNQTNGSEAIMANGRKIAGVATIAALGLALAGRSFLVASPSWKAQTGETADEEISDADCASLTPGTTLEFRGSFGTTAGSALIPLTLAVYTAFLWDAGDLLVDLAVNSIQLKRLVAAVIILGTGPLVGAIAATSGGGGCALVAGGVPAGVGGVALLAAAMLGASRLRRRRQVAPSGP